jgi:hypothetical protein
MRGSVNTFFNISTPTKKVVPTMRGTTGLASISVLVQFSD